MDHLQKKFTELDQAVMENFCIKRAQTIVRQKIKWSTMDYPQREKFGAVTKSFIQIFYLKKLVDSVVLYVGKDYVLPMVMRLLEEIAEDFFEGDFWNRLRVESSNIELIKSDEEDEEFHPNVVKTGTGLDDELNLKNPSSEDTPADKTQTQAEKLKQEIEKTEYPFSVKG